MNSHTRIEFIDLAKGICIILVIALHTMSFVEEKLEFLTAVRMPLYFCVAGLFFKDYGNIKNLLLKKTDKILIPFFAWYLIGYLIYYSFLLFTGSYPSKPHNIFDLFIGEEFINIPLWFLLSLFWCNLIYALINKISDKLSIQLIFISLLSLSGWLITYKGNSNYLYIGSSMTCIPFFYLGILLRKSNLLSPEINKKQSFAFLIPSIIFVLGTLLLVTDIPCLNYKANTIRNGVLPIIYTFSFSLIIIVLNICKYINRLPFVSWFGRYSIIPLVTHGLFTNILFNDRIISLLPSFFSDTNIEVLVFLLTITFTSLMIPLCKKYMPYITAQKSLLENKIIRQFSY